jgi:hypothetical protein
MNLWNIAGDFLLGVDLGLRVGTYGLHLFLRGFHLRDNALKPRQKALKFVDFLVDVVYVLFTSLIPVLWI